MKKTLQKLSLLMTLMVVGMTSAWAETTTSYKFTSKAWAAESDGVVAEWTSIKDGNQLTAGRGVQVTTGASGASATSPVEFSDVTKVVVTYSTNASKGAGEIIISVGDVEYVADADVTSAGGTADRVLTYTAQDDNASGKVKILVNCTTNSIYIKSIEVVEAGSVSKTETTMVLDGKDSFELNIGETDFPGPLAHVEYVDSEGETQRVDEGIIYSSDNVEVATVNAETGVVSAVSEGTAVITATYAGSETLKPATVSYTVIVVDNSTIVEKVKFVKVTDVKQLLAGNEYVIVSDEQDVIMGAQNGTYRSKVDVSVSDDYINVDPDEVAVLTLGGISGAWTFKASDNTYLAWSSGNTVISADDATVDNAQWVITDEFKLQNKADATRVLQYNASSPRFACYTSTQKPAVLYVKDGSPINNMETATVEIDEQTLLLGETTATFSFTPAGIVATYKSDNEEVATVAEGVVTPVAAGTATITVSWDAQTVDETRYDAGSASFTITVVDPNAPGLTAENAFTVAEAIAAIDNGVDPDAIYYVKGIVSQVDEYSSQYNNITYWISDDGTTNTQLESYRGLGFDGARFTSINGVKVGDAIVVKGKLTYYAAKEIYEFAQNNEIVSMSSSREVGIEMFATVCLPYAATIQGAVAYNIAGKVEDAEGSITAVVLEEETGTLVAGKPYIIQGVESTMTVSYQGGNVAAPVAATGLVGNLDEAAVAVPDNMYILSKNVLRQVQGGTVSIAQNRAYFDLTSVPVYEAPTAGVKVVNIFGQDATAIENLTPAISEGEGVIYNLAGQRVNTLQKGINIVGGKKVLVK